MKRAAVSFPARVTLRSFILALLLHVVAGVFLVVSLDLTPETIVVPHRDVSVVNAVTVDSRQVEAEVRRLQEAERREQEEEQREQKEMEQRLADLRKQATETESRRKAEEQRLARVEREAERERKERAAEEQRVAELKKRQQELERKRREEEQRRRQEEERKQQQEEERRRKEEEERKRQAAEAALKQQMAEEQKALQAAQARQDQGVINEYGARIRDAITREFNTAGLPPGLSCELQIRMIPGGDVVEARVVRSSGNAIFDRRAEVAVNKASPLPVPDNPRIFEKMRTIKLEFVPQQ